MGRQARDYYLAITHSRRGSGYARKGRISANVVQGEWVGGMTKRKAKRLPFDSKGGLVAVPLRLLKSEQYCRLSPEAKVLMLMMQVHWRPDDPVAYGVREAMAKISCAKGTAQRAFDQLQSAGFIALVDDSMFSSRTQSRARTWRLTWMPYMGKAPTQEWEKNKYTGSKMHLLDELQGQKCTC